MATRADERREQAVAAVSGADWQLVSTRLHSGTTEAIERARARGGGGRGT